MSLKTKMKIADTLESLLKSKHISKLTISDIVEASDISRQTFYNNFIDIYDLFYWTHATRIKEAVDTFWEEEDFCQAVETATTIMRNHKNFYQQIIQKDGVNSFQRLFAQQNIVLSKVRIKTVSNQPITETIDFLLQLYWHGTSQMLINWILDGMKEEPDKLAWLFYEGLPQQLRQYWPDVSKKHERGK